LKKSSRRQIFSIITDTTQDVSKIDQLSQIFRYGKISKQEDGNPSELEICESFLGFYANTDQTASGIASQVVEIIESKGLIVDKCRGQGYDGARTMSGIYTGVQKRILALQPKAIYVHCAAHNLNLVINDAVSAVPQIASFFNTLQELYVFLGTVLKDGIF